MVSFFAKDQKISTDDLKDIIELIEKGKENQISQSIEINDKIDAPLKKGDIVGKVVFSLDSTELCSTNLVTSCSINKISLFTMSKKIIYSWIDLLRH